MLSSTHLYECISVCCTYISCLFIHIDLFRLKSKANLREELVLSLSTTGVTSFSSTQAFLFKTGILIYQYLRGLLEESHTVFGGHT